MEKSTIANLLLRMYDIFGGQILIDDKDISEYNVGELRRQIGIVMQEPLLFNTTIKEIFFMVMIKLMIEK